MGAHNSRPFTHGNLSRHNLFLIKAMRRQLFPIGIPERQRTLSAHDASSAASRRTFAIRSPRSTGEEKQGGGQNGNHQRHPKDPFLAGVRAGSTTSLGVCVHGVFISQRPDQVPQEDSLARSRGWPKSPPKSVFRRKPHESHGHARRSIDGRSHCGAPSASHGQCPANGARSHASRSRSSHAQPSCTTTRRSRRE